MINILINIRVSYQGSRVISQNIAFQHFRRTFETFGLVSILATISMIDEYIYYDEEISRGKSVSAPVATQLLNLPPQFKSVTDPLSLLAARGKN